MKNSKLLRVVKSLAIMLGVVATIGVATPAEVKADTTDVSNQSNFIELEVGKANNYDEFLSSEKVYTTKYNLTEVAQDYFYKFTIDEDSMVLLKMKARLYNESGLPEYRPYINGSYTVSKDYTFYNNLTVQKSDCGALMDYDMLDNFNSFWFRLKKGTYYINVNAAVYKNYLGEFTTEPRDIEICLNSIPLDKSVNVTYEKKGKDYYLNIESPFNELIDQWYYSYGNNFHFVGSVLNFDSIKTDTTKSIKLNTKELDRYGNYVCAQGHLAVETYTYNDSKHSFGQIIKIDRDAPTVKGVKNGVTYKKSVKITFKDASGVKKATLNGKAIKSGTKVTKKGSYTLKLTDKIGNSKTVKFKIKK